MTLYDVANRIANDASFEWENDRLNTRSELADFVDTAVSDFAYENSNSPQQEDALYDDLLDLVDKIVEQDDKLNNLPINIEEDVFQKYERE